MKAFYVTITILFFIPICGHAQVLNPDSSMPMDTTVYNVVDDMPQFPGGEEALFKYIAEHLEVSKKEAKKYGGLVYVSFLVDEQGNLSEVEIMKSSQSKEIDARIVEMISKMPTWSPGVKDGEIVKVRYQLPIKIAT